MTNTIAAFYLATNVLFQATNFPLICFTNTPPVAHYNERQNKLTISPDFTGKLFIGTNEFQIVRTTNVVFTVEPKGK